MPFSPFSVRPALPCFPGASVSAVTLTGSRIFLKIDVIWLAQFHHLLWETVHVQTIVAMSPRQNFIWETLWERKIIIILRGRFFLKQKKTQNQTKKHLSSNVCQNQANLYSHSLCTLYILTLLCTSSYHSLKTDILYILLLHIFCLLLPIVSSMQTGIFVYFVYFGIIFAFKDKDIVNSVIVSSQ